MQAIPKTRKHAAVSMWILCVHDAVRKCKYCTSAVPTAQPVCQRHASSTDRSRMNPVRFRTLTWHLWVPNIHLVMTSVQEPAAQSNHVCHGTLANRASLGPNPDSRRFRLSRPKAAPGVRENAGKSLAAAAAAARACRTTRVGR